MYINEDPSPNNPSGSAHHQCQLPVGTLDDAGDEDMDDEDNVCHHHNNGNNNRKGGEGHTAPSSAFVNPSCLHYLLIFMRGKSIRLLKEYYNMKLQVNLHDKEIAHLKSGNESDHNLYQMYQIQHIQNNTNNYHPLHICCV